MQFTKRTIVVSRASAVEAEQRVDRYGRLVETRARAGDLATEAIALLLVMEQSLLLMRRFLARWKQISSGRLVQAIHAGVKAKRITPADAGP